jgi:hypothetical protein
VDDLNHKLLMAMNVSERAGIHDTLCNPYGRGLSHDPDAARPERIGASPRECPGSRPSPTATPLHSGRSVRTTTLELISRQRISKFTKKIKSKN